jgi:hypothetical protein
MQTSDGFYGCKKGSISIPKKLAKIIRNTVNKPVLRVPRRKVGLTSSGMVLECHTNVERLVDIYGGQQLVGYEIQMNYGPNRAISRHLVRLLLHSVWITPEGKAVDVTKKENTDLYSYNENETLFFPIDYVLDKECKAEFFPLQKVFWYKGQSNFMYTDYSDQTHVLKPSIALNSTITDFDPEFRFYKDEIISQFSLPSLHSGKTDMERLNEINIAA